MLDDDDIFSRDDDDVFNPNQSTNEEMLGGQSTTPKRKTQIPSHIPGYLRSALEKYIEDNPGALSSLYKSGRDIPDSVINYSHYDMLLSVTTRMGADNSVDRAVISVLDEITDGEITRRSKVYEFERALIAAHANLKTANVTYEMVTQANRSQTVDSIQFLEYLTAYITITQYSIGDLVDRYQQVCDMAGMEPELSVVEDGILEEADLGYTECVNIPAFKIHHTYGEMESVCAVESDMSTHWVRLAMNLIFTGEDISTETTE